MSTWRDHAAPIIERVLEENAGRPLSEIRKALRDAYPYGEKRYHPYKIWCDEVKKQMLRLKLIEAKKEPVDTSELPLWLRMEQTS